MKGRMFNCKVLKLVGLSILFFLLESCFITNTPGFYSGYKKLSNSEKMNIEILPENQSITNVNFEKGFIYSITGNQLFELLTKNDTSVVYFFSPNCSSEECVPISKLEDYCVEKKYNLFVIVQYYDNLDVTRALNPSQMPLFSINHFYYKSDYCNKYTKLFLKDLLKINKNNKSEYKRHYVFYKGELLEKKLEL